jgi:hypothetical protein
MKPSPQTLSPGVCGVFAFTRPAVLPPSSSRPPPATPFPHPTPSHRRALSADETEMMELLAPGAAKQGDTSVVTGPNAV